MGASAWIAAGWRVYRENLGRMILGVLALVAFYLILLAAGGGITYLFGPLGIPDLQGKPHPFIAFVIAVLSMTVGAMLYVGYNYYVLKLARGERAGIVDDLLYPFRRPLAVIGVTILYSLAIFIGFILLIIPGIILSLRYLFAGIALVDRDLGVVDSMSESADITRGHKFPLFLLLLFFALVLGIPLDLIGRALGGGAKILLDLVSLFIVTPWQTAALMCAYNDLLGEAIGEPEEA